MLKPSPNSLIYSELKNHIESLMETNDVDYLTMAKIVNKLANDFSSVRKKRYP